jgi:hypothetical protein
MNDADSKSPVPWEALSAERQLKLREQYGRYLDSLPPTCSLETKIERFRHWLNQRGILYK